MKTENKVLMAQARESLKGNWGKSVGITVAGIGIVMAVNVIPYIGQIALYFINGAILFGMALFFLNLSRGKEANVDQLFEGFNYYGRTLGTYLLYALSIFVVLLPSVIILATVKVMQNMSTIQHPIHVSPIWVLVAVILFIPGIIVMYMYSQTFYILVDEPNIKPLEALRKSKKMMYGNKMKMFRLGLRFIWWALLCIAPMIVCFIVFGTVFALTGNMAVSVIFLFLAIPLSAGFLWLVPYMKTTHVKFYEDIKKNFETTQNNSSVSDTPTIQDATATINQTV